ncbi:MAG: SEL1-like repeat protein [Nitrospira sp.]
MMYRDGIGVQQDYREAIKWLLLSKERGGAGG